MLRVKRTANFHNSFNAKRDIIASKTGIINPH
jgi:hypothetical protein